ncbi:MAG: hypothetical protein WD898_02580, partial [Candidatus Paceibacterota bacterium]
ILFFTINKVPQEWAKYHRDVLLEAAGDYPIISVSRKPVDIGTNLIDEGQKHISNLYTQLLQACKVATTPHIAMCEDDTLYTKSHFDSFRPPLDTFAYNIARWSIYTWGEPIYSWRGSQVGAAVIAPREKMIEQLEHRFAKFAVNGVIPKELCGEIGLRRFEKQIGANINKWVDFYSEDPIIQVNHDYFSVDNNSPEDVEKRHRKRMGRIRAFEIPYWGKGSDLVKKFI